MWKKTMVLFGASALLLVGCNNNQDEGMPDNNETPMEDMREEGQDMVPGTNDETPGIDEGINDGTNGTNNGMNGNGNNDTNLDEDKDMMQDENTDEEEILEDDMDMRDTDNNDQ